MRLDSRRLSWFLYLDLLVDHLEILYTCFSPIYTYSMFLTYKDVKM